MPITKSMTVIAVGCLFEYRKLMAAKGEVLTGKQSELDCEELCVSTCKITKVFLLDFPCIFNMVENIRMGNTEHQHICMPSFWM